MTRAELAAACIAAGRRTDRTEIVRYEESDYYPRLPTFAALARVLGVSMEVLWRSSPWSRSCCWRGRGESGLAGAPVARHSNPDRRVARALGVAPQPWLRSPGAHAGHDFCCTRSTVGVGGRKEPAMELLTLVAGLLAGAILVWAVLGTGRG